MKILLFILIMPEVFFVVRQIIGMADKLTLWRHLILNLYVLVLIPILLERLDLYLVFISMFLLNLVLNYVLLKIPGNHNHRKSFFLGLASFLGRVAAVKCNSIMTRLALRSSKEKALKMIRWRFKIADPGKTTNFILFFFEPFLLMFKLKKEGSKYFTRPKFFWILLSTGSLLAAIFWVATIYFSGFRI